MKAALLGAGLFARGFDSFEALRVQMAGGPQADAARTAKAPRPALVPARELRRLPDAARLGVEVASQACRMAGVATDAVLPIFTSTIGDSAITDYMCRTLAGEEKLLSPLRFQNSVHNAPAGSLSILTGNRHPSSFVSAFDHSLALALLEALVSCGTQPLPVLVVCTDVPVPAPLSDVHGEGELGGCALLLASPRAGAASPVTLTGTVQADPMCQPDGALPVSSAHRPATVQAWPLLEALAAGHAWSARLPVGSGSALHIDVCFDGPLGGLIEADPEPA